MASGRVGMRFSAEISQANAQIGKLNAQLRKQQRELQRLKNEGQASSKAQQGMLVNMTRNISAAAIAYRGLSEAIQHGNAALQRMQELQEGNIAPAEKLGLAAKKFWVNLGADLSTQQRARATTELFKAIEDAGVTEEQGLRFAGAVATGLGAAGFENIDKYLEAIDRISDVAMPLAGAYDPEAVGMLTADFTKFGFTIEESVSTMVALQKELHHTDLAAQQFLMRAVASGRVFHQEWSKLSDERRKQVAREMLAIGAGLTQEMLTVGVEMPSTAAAGLIMTAKERWGPDLEGKSPFEVLQWIRDTGLWETLEFKDIRGESIAKSAVQDIFRGGEAFKTIASIEQALAAAKPEDAARLIEQFKTGVPGVRQPAIATEENRRRFVEGLIRSEPGFAGPAQLEENRKTFERLFQTAEAYVPWGFGRMESYVQGAAISPAAQRRRLLTTAQRQALFQRNPLFATVAATSGPAALDAMVWADMNVPSVNEMLRSWFEDPGNRLGLEEELTSGQMKALRNALRAIDEAEERAMSDQNVNPDASNNANTSAKEQARQTKAAIEQTGAGKAVGRHTEAD